MEELRQRKVADEAMFTLNLVQEMATLMQTGLDRETTALLANLCEAGANPEALAVIVKELRRETAMLASTNPSTLSTSSSLNTPTTTQRL